MAATETKLKQLAGGSFCDLCATELSALESDVLVNVDHNGPSGAAASLVIPVVTTGATDGSQVTAEWIKGSDSTTNNTVAVRARVETGGDITGAVVTCYMFFTTRASAGLSPP